MKVIYYFAVLEIWIRHVQAALLTERAPVAWKRHHVPFWCHVIGHTRKPDTRTSSCIIPALAYSLYNSNCHVIVAVRTEKKSGIDLKPARSTRTSTHKHQYIAQPMTTAYNVWIVEVHDVTSVQGQLKLGCDISDKVSVATNRAKGKKEAMKGRLGTFTIIYACFDLKHQLKDNQHTDTSTRCLVTSQHKSPMLLNLHVCLQLVQYYM